MLFVKKCLQVLCAITLALAMFAITTTQAATSTPAYTTASVAQATDEVAEAAPEVSPTAATSAATTLGPGCREMTTKTDSHICVKEGPGWRATLYAVENDRVLSDLVLPARTGISPKPDPVTHQRVKTHIGSHQAFRLDRDHRTEVGNLPMPFSIFFWNGQAIHFSSNFRQVNYGNDAKSWGCINLNNWAKAEKLFNWVEAYGKRTGKKMTINVVAYSP